MARTPCEVKGYRVAWRVVEVRCVTATFCFHHLEPLGAQQRGDMQQSVTWPIHHAVNNTRVGVGAGAVIRSQLHRAAPHGSPKHCGPGVGGSEPSCCS